jgi:hypothetical protein
MGTCDSEEHSAYTFGIEESNSYIFVHLGSISLLSPSMQFIIWPFISLFVLCQVRSSYPKLVLPRVRYNGSYFNFQYPDIYL